MFLGHYGVAFGAKAAAPKTSLGTLLLAAVFVDLLWPVLLLTGVERAVIEPGATRVTPIDFVYYPFSHSLLAVAAWAALFGMVYFMARRDYRAAVVLGLLVFSHWLLDAIVHRPDLPLYPGGGQFIGLGLWSSLPSTLIAELLIFGAGVCIYSRHTAPSDGFGRWALWGYVTLLTVVYLASVFGPPPPSVTAIAIAGQGQWLFVVLAVWVDRHRQHTT